MSNMLKIINSYIWGLIFEDENIINSKETVLITSPKESEWQSSSDVSFTTYMGLKIGGLVTNNHQGKKENLFAYSAIQ